MAKQNDNQEKTEKENRIKGKNGGARPGAGRPPFVPSDDERKQVEALSGYGLPQEQIAILIRGGIGLDTLREHFATELVSGKAKANGQVGKTLFQKAMSGDTAAMIWWSKAQMRWAETQKHEIGGSAENPLKIERIERVVIGEVIEQRAIEKKVEDDA